VSANSEAADDIIFGSVALSLFILIKFLVVNPELWTAWQEGYVHVCLSYGYI
jgi:hypothetical protein